jgi:hypothetical protein
MRRYPAAERIRNINHDIEVDSASEGGRRGVIAYYYLTSAAEEIIDMMEGRP